MHFYQGNAKTGTALTKAWLQKTREHVLTVWWAFLISSICLGLAGPDLQNLLKTKQCTEKNNLRFILSAVTVNVRNTYFLFIWIYHPNCFNIIWFSVVRLHGNCRLNLGSFLCTYPVWLEYAKWLHWGCTLHRNWQCWAETEATSDMSLPG